MDHFQAWRGSSSAQKWSMSAIFAGAVAMVPPAESEAHHKSHQTRNWESHNSETRAISSDHPRVMHHIVLTLLLRV
jgi:hypothetical protein